MRFFQEFIRHSRMKWLSSSAGIIEAASFSTPVVNVGDRQRLRERSANVVDVRPDADAIHAVIATSLQAGKVPCDNVYGDATAGPRIAGHLTTLSLERSVLDKSNSY